MDPRSPTFRSTSLAHTFIRVDPLPESLAAQYVENVSSSNEHPGRRTASAVRPRRNARPYRGRFPRPDLGLSSPVDIIRVIRARDHIAADRIPILATITRTENGGRGPLPGAMFVMSVTPGPNVHRTAPGKPESPRSVHHPVTVFIPAQVGTDIP